jgi:hypothetical protein
MSFMIPTETATVVAMRFRLAEWAEDGVLAGRLQAERVRGRLTERLEKSGPQSVGIDAEGVGVMSWPFADSFFGPLLLARNAGYYADHPMFVAEANRDICETIEAVMRERGTALVAVDGKTRLLGGEPALQLALSKASEIGGTFSATRLGIELGVSPQAANNRLKALVAVGALVRISATIEGGGREFEYRIPDVELDS